jgi:hypothetical protein
MGLQTGVCVSGGMEEKRNQEDRPRLDLRTLVSAGPVFFSLSLSLSAVCNLAPCHLAKCLVGVAPCMVPC